MIQCPVSASFASFRPLSGLRKSGVELTCFDPAHTHEKSVTVCTSTVDLSASSHLGACRAFAAGGVRCFPANVCKLHLGRAIDVEAGSFPEYDCCGTGRIIPSAVPDGESKSASPPHNNGIY